MGELPQLGAVATSTVEHVVASWVFVQKFRQIIDVTVDHNPTVVRRIMFGDLSPEELLLSPWLAVQGLIDLLRYGALDFRAVGHRFRLGIVIVDSH